MNHPVSPRLHPRLREPTRAVPAKGHMPFPGHRTQREVRLDEDYYQRWLHEERRLVR